jgi:hypothetical protein
MNRKSIVMIIIFSILPSITLIHFSEGMSKEKSIYEQGFTLSCACWETIDISFKLTQSVEHPYDEVFGAIFRGPNGVELNVPGFYSGNGEFIIRFSPTELGNWTFTTYSTQSELSEKMGKIHVKENENPNLHGPLIIKKDNPQHFFYADGTPYFLMAFECDWLFALDLDNPVDIPKTKQLIDLVAKHGFNQIIMNVYAYDVQWQKNPDLKKEHDYGSPKIYPFGGTNEKPDFSTLNVEFFNRLDRVIEYLLQKDVVAHLMIYVWNKKVNWPDMYSKADNRYFDYAVSRYQAFSNIVWDISKEALAYGRCDMAYVSERIARLRRLDAYKRLLTVHDYSYCQNYPQYVDFISIQTWRSQLYSDMFQIWQKHASQPVFNIEHGGYERGKYQVFVGDYTNPIACLERNYRCLFAGVYSTYYWQNSSWNVIIHDPMKLPDNEKPKLEYYRYLVDLFSKYSFSTLKPLQDASSSGYCLSNSEDLYLFVVPAQNGALHTKVANLVDREMNATWFNPLTGEYLESGRIQMRNWHSFQSPWENQMTVLILKK